MIVGWLGGALLVASSVGCEHDDGDHDHESEIISTVELTFTPANGGDPSVFKFTDPDGDGDVRVFGDDHSERGDRVPDDGALWSLVSPPEDLTGRSSERRRST